MALNVLFISVVIGDNIRQSRLRQPFAQFEAGFAKTDESQLHDSASYLGYIDKVIRFDVILT